MINSIIILVSIFPTKDADYNDYVLSAVPYLKTNKTRLGISDEQLVPLDTDTDSCSVFSKWLIIYPKSQDPAQSTTPISDEKNLLRKQLSGVLSDIYSGIRASVLTTEDCAVLRLKKGVGKDTVPTEIKVVDYAPDMKIEEAGRTYHNLRFSDPKNPESPRKMPEGNKIELQIYIGEPDLKEKDIKFDKTRTVTKYLYRVKFEEADKGKAVYYRACYKKGDDRSPYTAILSAVIGEAI